MNIETHRHYAKITDGPLQEQDWKTTLVAVSQSQSMVELVKFFRDSNNCPAKRQAICYRFGKSYADRLNGIFSKNKLPFRIKRIHRNWWGAWKFFKVV